MAAARKTFGLLLVAGSHTHQENYARAFRADPRCHLLGLTDEPDVPARRAELNRQLAEELQIPLLPNFEEAISREDVDLVSVCAEPERRAKIARTCLAAGKAVYLDKPLATTMDDATALVKAAEQAGVAHQVFSLVRHPLASRAKTVLGSGELGELIGLHCDLLFAKGIAGSADLSSIRQESAHATRFTFLDSKRELYCVGWYPLILFQWLTGRRFTEVAGTTANYFFAEHQRNGVEDFSSLLLGMEDGLEASITVGRSGWSSHPSHGIHQLHLVGTRGTVTLDAYEPRFEIHNDFPAWRQPETPHPEDPMGFWSSTQAAGGVHPKTAWQTVDPVMASDAACFLDCLEHNHPSDVPLAMGAEALRVILTGYQAAAEHRTIPLANE